MKFKKGKLHENTEFWLQLYNLDLKNRIECGKCTLRIANVKNKTIG